MKLTPEKLSDIEAKAKAATPGPWESWTSLECNGNQYGFVFFRGADNPSTNTRDCHLTKQDAEHIASADPETVIALVEKLAEYSSEIDAREATNADQDKTIADQAAEIEQLVRADDFLEGERIRLMKEVMRMKDNASVHTDCAVGLIECATRYDARAFLCSGWRRLAADQAAEIVRLKREEAHLVDSAVVIALVEAIAAKDAEIVSRGLRIRELEDAFTKVEALLELIGKSL